MTPAPSAPAPVRRAAFAALGVSLVHIVFGAIVRISGSGMGCGDHWPKCYGYWFPPLDRPDLIIEVFHRYLASLLLATVAAAVLVAWRHRGDARVGGPRGVLRAQGTMLGVTFFAAAFGAVTVNFANVWWATVVHKAIAVTTLALGLLAVMRAGGLGGAGIVQAKGTSKAVGGAMGAAALSLVVVLFGGLTAKIEGAAVACVGFPLCGDGSLGGAGQHVQLTHRVLAYLLVLHLISLPFVFRKRGEPAAVVRAAWFGLALGVLQIVWAGWMVTGGFPGVVRSLHQATGIAIWVVTFVMAYLARVAAGRTSIGGAAPGARSPAGAVAAAGAS